MIQKLLSLINKAGYHLQQAELHTDYPDVREKHIRHYELCVKRLERIKSILG